jgi:hypothetical protein
MEPREKDGHREWSQERKLDRSRRELAERVTREYTGRAAVFRE